MEILAVNLTVCVICHSNQNQSHPSPPPPRPISVAALAGTEYVHLHSIIRFHYCPFTWVSRTWSRLFAPRRWTIPLNEHLRPRIFLIKAAHLPQISTELPFGLGLSNERNEFVLHLLSFPFSGVPRYSSNFCLQLLEPGVDLMWATTHQLNIRKCNKSIPLSRFHG